jgi:hypothetical protein
LVDRDAAGRWSITFRGQAEGRPVIASLQEEGAPPASESAALTPAQCWAQHGCMFCRYGEGPGCVRRLGEAGAGGGR